MFKSMRNIAKSTKTVKSKVPFLKNVHLNFITLHYVYIIGCTIICSVIIYPGGQMSYTDALFHSVGSATQSGLNTIDINLLHTYQQVGLWFVTMIANPIVIHSFVVFIRLYWFERRFQHVVREAKALRRSKSRSRTVTTGAHDRDHDAEERGVRGRSIVVLRNNAGQAGRKMDVPEVVKPEDPESTSESGDSVKQNGESSQNTPGKDQPIDQEEKEENGSDRDGDDNASPKNSSSSDNDPELRAPAQLSPEHHIAFLENQRNERGALRIPSPREFDRGGGPQSLDDADGTDLGRRVTSQSEQSRPQFSSDQANRPQPSTTQHITIDEPDMFRVRSRTGTFQRVPTRRTMPEDADETTSTVGPGRRRRGTLTSVFRTGSQNREIEGAPYLSWAPTVGRNSAFVDLTEAQRDELGGIEYRALKTLAVILIGYFFFFHILGIVCVLPWIMKTTRFGDVVRDVGQGRPWWAIFTSGSSFNDQGFALTPDSMQSFYDAIFPLLLLSFLIVIGNTGFPCMLRFIIWTLSKMIPHGSAVWEELHFLLDHPRRCFTLLFPSEATWWLFGVLVILNGLDLILFIVLDVSSLI